MKKNLLAIFAVVLAIGFSSFTIKKHSAVKDSADALITRYAIFSADAGAVETDFAEYTFTTVQPTVISNPCSGTGKVCWFKMEYNDDGDNIVEAPEFNLFVDGASAGQGYDVDRDDVINDDHNETAGSYQERSL